ncbi:hypothetical protein GCM10011492_15660 [Flexivirga endophytica]|uniref:Uncharacterized protein n=1 Tax=Flexivirga endophytica TaxID=1849103 RepID=A0A916T2Q8_9MICO|nr:hypothetical protein [Flexivirga endophytica]GGB26319.1 hypothetical protein GCM10011492_15660 [Flexivirga endophytica]GHB54834.1 hypothetical protein GCM10008112_24980 [Flexivirga endophytica]
MLPVAISIFSAGIALVALMVSYRLGSRSARASERSAEAAEASRAISQRQLENSVRAQEAALQPYVWADVRPRDDGQILTLVVGNSGPTVATAVRVIIDPPLEQIVPERMKQRARRVDERLAAGFGSIAPHRTFSWGLGVAHEFFQGSDGPPVPELTITVVGEGPSGPLEAVEYTVALEDLRQQSARAVGVALLEPVLKKIAGSVERHARAAEAQSRRDAEPTELE